MPYLAKVMQKTARYSGNLDGHTSIEKITGETPEISKYIDFGFYVWVVYKNETGLGEVSLGRFLDISHGVGSLMSYWIFLESGIPISRSTVQCVTPENLDMDVMKQLCGTFDKATKEKFKDDVILEQGKLPTLEEYPEFAEDEEFVDEFQRVFSNEDIAEVYDEFE